VWTSADSPVTAAVATSAVALPHVIEVRIADSWMRTDGSSRPALAGEGKTDSPAAGALWQFAR